MSQPVVLQDSFSRGMRQDEPRTRMVKGAVWNSVDFIPDLDAPLTKRGGTSYASPDLASVSASATYVSTVVYANFASGAKLMATDQLGTLYQVASSASAATAGAVYASLQTPVMHSQKLIYPASDGTSVPKYYDGATSASISGPTAKYAAVYKDRTVLANTTAQMTRVYFSSAADPTTWDTTNGYVSVLSPVTGLAALPNALMVFQEKATSRIRGTTPPPGSDMIIDDPIFTVGCTDARSIVVTGPYAYFANPVGIYRTNGTSIPEDLTAAIGLKRYWKTLLGSYAASSWTLSGGIYQNYFFLVVMNGSSFVDCIVIDTIRLSAFRLSNVKAVAMAGAVTIGEELYAGLRSAARVIKLAGIFTPAAAVKNDADGVAVAPVLETAYFGSGQNRARATVKSAYLDYDARDAATDNPALTLSYVKYPQDSYTAVGATLAETTNRSFVRRPLRFSAPGVALKFAQSNASSVTYIYAIGADIYQREGSRVYAQ